MATISSAVNLMIFNTEPAEIRDAYVTAAVLAAGLAAVGALLAISVYISTKGKPRDETRISGRELIPPSLIVLGPLAIANAIAWWNVYGTRNVATVAVGVVFMVLGALLLRKSEE